MKTNLVITMAAAVLVLAGCHKDDKEQPDNWTGEIRLASGVTAQLKSRSIETGLQGNQIDASVKVGVFINENTNVEPAPTTYTQNMMYTADGRGGLSTASQPYFPQSGNGVDIYAYAPHTAGYTSGAKGAMSFTVQTNQSTKDAYLASDLIWGRPMKLKAGSTTDYETANPVARTSSVIHLSFKHMLSKIVVQLKPGNGLAPNDFQSATLSILNVLPTMTVTMNSGKLGDASGTKTDITAATYATVATSADLTASAIVVPQTIAKGERFLKVHLTTGGDLYYTLPKEASNKDLVLESGKIYRYEIQVDLTSLTVNTTVDDWELIGDGSPVTGNAVME